MIVEISFKNPRSIRQKNRKQNNTAHANQNSHTLEI